MGKEARADGKLMATMYVRYESPVPNSRGQNTGIFALANSLAHSGQLSRRDWS
ncbi:hypothetical protein [Mycobacteroides abscessus]|uniref:hypothetical protein n=1 Tax=Mycobacteroides abscessus TaxID=36809 RepID=UPI001F276DFE|nr:hypothetical protein [Mycobacteroides abscessus]